MSSLKHLSLLSHVLTRMTSKDDLSHHQVYHCNGSRATKRELRFVSILRSPERVLWAKEGVVCAEVEVVTGLRTLLLLGYGRQNLKQNFSLIKITSITSITSSFLHTITNTKLGINC